MLQYKEVLIQKNAHDSYGAVSRVLHLYWNNQLGRLKSSL